MPESVMWVVEIVTDFRKAMEQDVAVQTTFSKIRRIGMI